MLSMPDKFKVTLLQANTTNNYLFKIQRTKNNIRYSITSIVPGATLYRFIFDGVHFM